MLLPNFLTSFFLILYDLLEIFYIVFFPTFFFKFYKIILVTSRTRISFYFLLNYFIYSDISELQEKLSSCQKLLLKLYTIFHSSLFFYMSQMCSFFLQQNVQSLLFSDTFSLFCWPPLCMLLLFYFFIFLICIVCMFDINLFLVSIFLNFVTILIFLSDSPKLKYSVHSIY